MRVVEKIRKYGVMNAAKRAVVLGAGASSERYHRWRVRNAEVYASPTAEELGQIERDLRALGVDIVDYAPSPDAFHQFEAKDYFPHGYHGGVDGDVWDEKMLEHWISYELLGLGRFGPGDVYVDVAACGSPWARILREREGLTSHAIDLEIADEFRAVSYYRAENATATSFQNASVLGASLHCAYEMFVGNDDVNLIKEMSRILAPNGKMVISPLYMHTHYCAYSTAEYYGKGYTDAGAKEYVRLDCSGVRASRKYDARMLVERVLKPIAACGMTYKLLALRNKELLGKGIYCHFILEVTK